MDPDGSWTIPAYQTVRRRVSLPAASRPDAVENDIGEQRQQQRAT
jgi:hypothetical protein